MRQTWNDVLFAHWPVDVSILRALVPSVLELDTYNGQAWISMLPFCLMIQIPSGIEMFFC